MRAVLVLLGAILLAGGANQTLVAGGNGDCCGLTKVQWKAYSEKAADAVIDPAAWKKLGAAMPKGVRPSSRSGLFGTTNSPDGVRPPTKVTINVPIGNTVKDCSDVIVEFEHPAGKIKAMYATVVMYD